MLLKEKIFIKSLFNLITTRWGVRVISGERQYCNLFRFGNMDNLRRRTDPWLVTAYTTINICELGDQYI